MCSCVQRITLTVAVCLLVCSGAMAATTHLVTVGADGSFRPAVLQIHAGDTVEWVLPNRTTAIVRAVGPPAPNMCPVPKPFTAGDLSNFTGPMPFAPSGVFVMSPLERGNRVESGRCTQGPVLARVGEQVLCATGAPYETMDATWADPNATGVFIRLLWNRTQIAPGTADSSFDFTELDREVDKAVRHGKLYSLGFKAGADGTPDWLFSTPASSATANRGRGPRRQAGGRGRGASVGRAPATVAPAAVGSGGVRRLTLQDSGNFGRSCGATMDLGSPTDAMYQKHYFDLLRKVAAHLRSRSDWYRALAYIKPSGANLVSHENRLPQNCQAGCLCNTRVFAEAGYTPSGLYNFYRKQFELLAQEFPDKPMSYALIQDGFPLVNDSGGWENESGASSNGRPLPRGAEQTEHILDMGQEAYGIRFVVQHNGLQSQPPAGTCPNEGKHPAAPPYARVGTGCPNRWVLGAGADGKQVTGFQTVNAGGGVSTPAHMASAFRNALTNSDGSFVEVYEDRFWEATHAHGGVLPSGQTVAQWADQFHERRRTQFKTLPDPFPATYRHTFAIAGATPQTLYYFDPSTCRPSMAVFGTIVVSP